MQLGLGVSDLEHGQVDAVVAHQVGEQVCQINACPLRQGVELLERVPEGELERDLVRVLGLAQPLRQVGIVRIVLTFLRRRE